VGQGVQSSKVKFASPVQTLLVSSPVGTHYLIFARSKNFGNRTSSLTRGLICVSESAPHLSSRNSATLLGPLERANVQLVQ
jgi:hypothetical protein